MPTTDDKNWCKIIKKIDNISNNLNNKYFDKEYPFEDEDEDNKYYSLIEIEKVMDNQPEAERKQLVEGGKQFEVERRQLEAKRRQLVEGGRQLEAERKQLEAERAAIDKAADEKVRQWEKDFVG